MRCRVALMVALLASPVAAQSSWFPKRSRLLGRGTSASPDAPAVQYEFGPRAKASLGGELAVAGGERWHLGGSVLVGFENGDSGSVIPKQTWRDVETLYYAFAPTGTDLELELALGHAGAATTDTYQPSEGIDGDDIPFGAGGYWFGQEGAWKLQLGGGTLTPRLGNRLFMNAFPRMFGLKTEADFVADGLREGVTFAPRFELQWQHPAPWPGDLIGSVFAEALVAHDDSAQNGALVRALVGATFEFPAGRLMPFFAGELGNGRGALVNRREGRASLGVRYVRD